MSSLDTIDTVVRGSRPDTLYESPDEAQLANLVRELFYRARDVRRPLMRQWKRNYHVMNNRVWAPRAEPWMPAPEVAEIWPVVASLIAWMTDQRPILATMPSAIPFSPYADYYQMLSEQMNAALNATFSENFLDAEISKMLWDVATYGIGYTRTDWEPWLSDGIGDSVFRRRDPFSIYPDPYARSEDQLNYIIEAQIMTLDEVERSFPGARRKIATGWIEDTEEAPHRLDDTVNPEGPRLNLAPIAPATSPRWTNTPSPRAGKILKETPVVTLLTCWVRTYEVLPDSKDNLSAGGELPEGMARVAEKWRVVVTCGNCVLMDAAAEDVNAHGTHPYSRMVLFDTGEWYGPCLVEFLTSPQESINRLLGAIEQNMMLMGNPILVESPQSNSRRKRLTNRPGQRYEARPDQISWLNPPQMHPQIAVQLLQFYQSKIEAISGMSAIVRGFTPTARNASSVLDSVQDAAFVRIRATLRELERTLKATTSRMVANIAEFYTEPRLISLLGNDGKQTSMALKARNFYVPDDDKGSRIPLRFNLLADAGSQLPTSRQARSADAERLYAIGAIDVLELLKAKQWPNYSQVALRIMNQQAAAGTLGQPPGARQQAQRST